MLFYKKLACPDRKKELKNEVQGSLRVMDSQIKQLAIIIEEIQTHMKAFEHLTSEEKQKMDEKFHQLQIQLDSQSAEIATLKNVKDQAARTRERSEDAELNDDEYFEQMTRKVTVDEDLPLLASEDSDEEEVGDQSPEKQQQISQRVEERPSIEDLKAGEEDEDTYGEMEEMEEGESTSGETEETESTDAEDHYALLRDEALCITCLERCSPFDDCPHLHRRCYYCECVKGTSFEDMIDEFEHHTAVCGIPDLKQQARERLNAARRGFREAVIEQNQDTRRRRGQPMYGRWAAQSPGDQQRHAYDQQAKREELQLWRGGIDDDSRP
ncbi:hypothetical protein GCK32_002189 [Trichostrongylus colubriformis]|uniref:Uncharacterized protein n=1 Tax=Trichostrongylus colubriformis TaxID=6319 RepID=A0AAN8FQJ5_TRICO